MVVIFLSGMKAYNRILFIIFLGYLTMVIASVVLRHYNKEGLLLAFLLGHMLLLCCFLIEIIREFPIRTWFAFDFLAQPSDIRSDYRTAACQRYLRHTHLSRLPHYYSGHGRISGSYRDRLR